MIVSIVQLETKHNKTLEETEVLSVIISKMNLNLLSPRSDSTYCSELERTEERFQNFKKFKINYNPRDTFANTGSHHIVDPPIQETFNVLENQCKEKLDNLTKYYEKTINTFHASAFSQQNIFSPPLLLSATYTQEEDFMPLTQISNKNKTQKSFLRQISTSRQSNSSELNITKKSLGNAKFTGLNPVHSANFQASSYEGSYGRKPKNKIFETEEQYNFQNRKDFDTLSITSERVSKIVDNEIELHRKKRLLRLKQKSQHDLPKSDYQELPSLCPCVTNLMSNHVDSSEKFVNLMKIKQPKVDTNGHDNKKYIRSFSQVPESYNLTRNHIDKIANHFKIEVKELTFAIQALLNGQEIGEKSSDESDEINCSQSPVIRRYTCSQYTNTSNVSK